MTRTRKVRRDVVVKTLLTPAQAAAVKAAADKEDVSVSAFVAGAAVEKARTSLSLVTLASKPAEIN